jgi:hypothetical protein
LNFNCSGLNFARVNLGVVYRFPASMMMCRIVCLPFQVALKIRPPAAENVNDSLMLTRNFLRRHPKHVAASLCRGPAVTPERGVQRFVVLSKQTFLISSGCAISIMTDSRLLRMTITPEGS